jgi:hypothetical protein
MHSALALDCSHNTVVVAGVSCSNQCVKAPRDEPGSSMTMAKLRVPSGASDTRGRREVFSIAGEFPRDHAAILECGA